MSKDLSNDIVSQNVWIRKVLANAEESYSRGERENLK
jgi:hypothetical protein